MAPQPIELLDSADNGHDVTLNAPERRVLAALARRPRGLRGEASVAAAAGVSCDEARGALSRLAGRRLVTAESLPERGGARETHGTVWRLEVGDDWFGVAESVRGVVLPESERAVCPEKLPVRFEHLFWWGDPTVIELPRDAAFVAEHVLACHDIDAWAWVLAALPAEALDRVANKRRTRPETRAMIRNALRRRGGIPL